MVKRLILIAALLLTARGASAQTLIGDRLTLKSLSTASGTSCVAIDANGVVSKTGATCQAGDVTGVSFTLPSIFSSVSPCTTGDCAFTFSLATQTTNLIFASPNGSTGAPTFRNIVAADFGSSIGANLVLARSTGTGAASFQSLTKAMLPATVVHTDQTNTFGAFLQTFGGGLTVSSGTTSTQALTSTTGTFSGAIAANGGSITSTAATLGIDAGGTINFVDKVTFGGNLGGNLLPTLSDTYDIGSYAFPWNQGFISQLNAVVFAETQATLFGGYSIIGKNAGTFGAATGTGTTVNFGKAMSAGWVEVRAYDSGGTIRNEFMLVGSLVSGTTYNVTRGLSTGGTGYDFPSGTPFLINGISGDGRIELNAYTSPKISVFKQGATYGAKTTMAKMGDLNGDYGFSSSTFGFGAGDYTDESITIEPTDGFKIMNNGTKRVQFDGTNGLRLFKSDGSTVALQLDMAGNASFTGNVTAGGGTIGNWTIGTNTLSATNIALTSGAANTANIAAGSGANAGGINSANAGGDIVFWGGSTFANRATAPFRVTAAGALTATSGTFTGTINSGSSITGTTFQTTSTCGTSGGACAKITTAPEIAWWNASNQKIGQIDGSGIMVGNQSAGTYSYNVESSYRGYTTDNTGGLGQAGLYMEMATAGSPVKRSAVRSVWDGTTGNISGIAESILHAEGAQWTGTRHPYGATFTAKGEPVSNGWSFLWDVNNDGTSSRAMTLNSTGLGIGTTPSYKLDALLSTENGTTGGNAMFRMGEGQIQIRNLTSDVVELHIRSANTAGSGGWVSFTENGTADRWAIGAKTGDAGLYVKQASATGTDFFKFNTSNSRPAFDALSGTWGTGASAYGSAIGVGNNTSGNGAAGAVAFYRRSGTIDFVWADNAGNLRINSTQPTESLASPNYDTTTGTVVGTQTSSRRFKNILGERTDYDAMRAVVLNAPVWDFTYKSGAFGGETFTGITCEDTPEFCMDEGKSLNPANAIGHLIGTIKAQQAQIDALLKRVETLEHPPLPPGCKDLGLQGVSCPAGIIVR